jgi:hypothetical protein
MQLVMPLFFSILYMEPMLVARFTQAHCRASWRAHSKQPCGPALYHLMANSIPPTRPCWRDGSQPSSNTTFALTPQAGRVIVE